MTKEYGKKEARKRRGCCKFEHLNPSLQRIIGQKGDFYKSLLEFAVVPRRHLSSRDRENIKSFRGMRAYSDTMLGVSGAITYFDKNPGMKGIFAAFGAMSLAVRTDFAHKIQKKHAELVGCMKGHGILLILLLKGITPRTG